jgi:hypothetical protein
VKNLVFACILVLAITVMNAQAPTTAPPPAAVNLVSLNFTAVTNDSLQTGADLQALLTQAAGNQNAIGAQGNATVAYVTDPAIGNAALDARLKKLEAMLLPSTTPPNVFDLTTLTAGPLTGMDKNGINWNSGQWIATAQGVQPAVQSSGRNFVVPGTAALTSLTIECLTTACQVKFTDAAGETVTSTVLTPGVAAVLPTKWTQPAGAVTVSMVAQAATDLRLRSVTF